MYFPLLEYKIKKSLVQTYLVIGGVIIGRGLFLLGSSRFSLNFFGFFFLLLIGIRVIRRRRLFLLGSFLGFSNCGRFLYLLFLVRWVFIGRGLFLLSSSRLSLNFFGYWFCFFLVIRRVFVRTFFFGSRFSFYLFSDWKNGLRKKLDFVITKTLFTTISLKPRLI